MSVFFFDKRIVQSLDPVLRSNIYGSIYNPNSFASWGVPQFLCASGNCTWSPTANLAVRSVFKNATPLLQRQCQTSSGRVYCNLSLGAPESPRLKKRQTMPTTLPIIPNNLEYYYSLQGHDWGGEIMLISLDADSAFNTPDGNRDPNLVFMSSIIPLDLVASLGQDLNGTISNTTRWIATECSLSLYVRSVNVSVQDSVYQESTLATWSDTVTAPYDDAHFEMEVGFIVPENHTLGVYPGMNFTTGFETYASLWFGL